MTGAHFRECTCCGTYQPEYDRVRSLQVLAFCKIEWGFTGSDSTLEGSRGPPDKLAAGQVRT